MGSPILVDFLFLLAATVNYSKIKFLARKATLYTELAISELCFNSTVRLGAYGRCDAPPQQKEGYSANERRIDSLAV